MNVVIQKVTGPEVAKARTTLAASSAYASAGAALLALATIPPTWYYHQFTPSYAAYIAPGDNHCHVDVIIARQEKPPTTFLG